MVAICKYTRAIKISPSVRMILWRNSGILKQFVKALSMYSPVLQVGYSADFSAGASTIALPPAASIFSTALLENLSAFTTTFFV